MYKCAWTSSFFEITFKIRFKHIYNGIRVRLRISILRDRDESVEIKQQPPRLKLGEGHMQTIQHSSKYEREE